MASTLPESRRYGYAGEKAEASTGVRETMEWLLAPLASLRLTVILLTLSVVLVFLGTVAQWHKDIWVVVDEYFRCWISWVSLDDCIPPKMWPTRPTFPAWMGFYFFGGKTLLLALAANLLAAHGIRFKVQASGARLWAGVGVIALGVMTTVLVVLSGSNKAGIHSGAMFSWDTIWWMFIASLTLSWLAAVFGSFALPAEPKSRVWAVRGVAVALGVTLGALFYAGDSAMLDASSMRILWQLAKGTLAGVVLLGGAYLVFKQRAPVVVLHAGVGLMMINELVVHTMHVESQMHIAEGETATYTNDVRRVDLALVTPTGDDEETVTTIPQEMLRRSADKGSVISDSRLPFDIKVVNYLKNSTVSQRKADQTGNPATVGIGLSWNAEPVREGAGTDVGGKVDIASAYIQFLDKPSGRDLGTYLLSQMQDMMPVLPPTQKLDVNGKPYDVALRFHRIHKPYAITLEDVKKEDYLGTDTPRDYSSYVRLVDPELNVDSQVRIWMNNPLRFREETFYQQGYNVLQGGREMTTLQVVSNFGWMIPYVGCMIVVVGMTAQFGATLMRFLRRRAEGRHATTVPAAKSKKLDSRDEVAPARAGIGSAGMIFTAVILLVGVAATIYSARVPAPKEHEMNLYEFGEIPIAYEGRLKPLDTLARNTLRIISNSETFVDETEKRQPAIKWLLDVVTDREILKNGEKVSAAEQHHVFKIDNFDVQSLLGLKPRQRFRYGLAEFRGKAKEFNDEVVKVNEKAKKTGDVSLNPYERALMDLDTRVRRFTLVQAAFRAPDFGQLPTPADFEKNAENARERGTEIIQRYQGFAEMLEGMKPPRAIPAANEDAKDKWQIMSISAAQADFQRQIQGDGVKLNPALENMSAIFAAYADTRPEQFNTEVARYLGSLEKQPPHDYRAKVTNFEAFFNHFRPFYLCWMLYLLAFALSGFSLLGWSGPLGRSAFWLMIFTLSVHTLGIVGRIYISGRPPVTNLYTTAIFIGWGCVVLSLIIEVIYKLGIGNLIAAAIGVATLEIADRLAADGDTFTVLQAVLDTQFWLATHVVCINLGYATTILAGVFGLAHSLRRVSPVVALASVTALVLLILGLAPSAIEARVLVGAAVFLGCLVFAKRDDVSFGPTLTRMMYGTLCFAIFFSFFGTVLGGLWADDSWGRFWGWDPKENGALMIVLWNAIALHARWGKIVSDRGFANLCILGNVVTAWSWFVVNDLGIGLHAYGSTEGTFSKFYVFGLSQLLVVALTYLPRRDIRTPQLRAA